MTAPMSREQREAAVVETMARAIYEADRVPSCATPWESAAPLVQGAYRRLAVAAVAAYRATQDGGAEAAVWRVEALAEEIDAEAAEKPEMPFPTTWAAKRIRAALAPQAGAGQ